MIMRIRIFLSALLAASLLISCKKDEPVNTNTTGFTINPGDGIFICDEGNFQGGNAEVSFYRFSDQFTQEDLFRPRNVRPLGDVCQSMTLINGSAA